MAAGSLPSTVPAMARAILCVCVCVRVCVCVCAVCCPLSSLSLSLSFSLYFLCLPHIASAAAACAYVCALRPLLRLDGHGGGRIAHVQALQHADEV